MTRIEVIIVRSGERGNILAGAVLGKAAAYSGKKATQFRSCDADERLSCQIRSVTSDEETEHHLVIKADALSAMSQLAPARYITKVKANDTAIVEEDMAKPKQIVLEGLTVIKISAARIVSQELQQPIVANMINARSVNSCYRKSYK